MKGSTQEKRILHADSVQRHSFKREQRPFMKGCTQGKRSSNVTTVMLDSCIQQQEIVIRKDVLKERNVNNEQQIQTLVELIHEKDMERQ